MRSVEWHDLVCVCVLCCAALCSGLAMGKGRACLTAWRQSVCQRSRRFRNTLHAQLNPVIDQCNCVDVLCAVYCCASHTNTHSLLQGSSALSIHDLLLSAGLITLQGNR